MNLAESVPAKSDDIGRYVSEVIGPVGVSAAVLCAFGEVDRAEFVPKRDKHVAYTNQIIDVKGSFEKLSEVMSTISEPRLVARMVNLLELTGHERVLEVGTATGYQAAILSRLAAEVDTVEIDPTLAEVAANNLERLGYFNVKVHSGDGAKGVKERAPFDAIIVTAALKSITKPLLDQLVIGGRIVAPIGPHPDRCTLKVIRKTAEEEISNEDHGDCRFVPAISDEEGTWTLEELGKLRELEEQEKVERERKLEIRRKHLKEWLTARWAEHDLSYEDGIAAVGSQVLKILGEAEDPRGESATLDIIDFVFYITQPAKKAKPNNNSG